MGVRVRHHGLVVLTGLAAACGAAVLPSGGADAQSDGRAELTVDVGVNGRSETGDPVLVHVTVTADELIDGELIASVRNTTTTLREDIEIAAGTTKEYTFTLPSMWEPPRVEVTVLDGGDEVASQTVNARFAEDELVGVLPRLAARFEELPDQVRLPESVGSAQIMAVTPAIVDLGVIGLQSFDTIVAGADDLAELTPAQRDDILRWVSMGGILVLDDGAALADVPTEWAPGPNGVAWAGLGEIHVVDGAATDGEWADIIPPTSIGPTSMFMGGEMMSDPQMDLAGRSGLDLPSISPLAIGIGAYAVVLGPGVYLLLRRWRRLTLGWFVIPAVAVLTAGGIAVAGSGAFKEGEPATANFVQTTPGGAYSVSTVLTYSSTGGRSELTLPSGWGNLSNGFFFSDGSSLPVSVEPNADGTTTTRMTLEATQASVRSYEGRTVAVPLELTAEVEGGEIVGTVTNNTRNTLYDVAVFAGKAQTLIEALPAGETAEWTVRAPADLEATFDTRGSRVWGEPWGPNGPRENSGETPIAEFGIWGTASVRLDLFPAGMARVVGWTDDMSSDLIEDAASNVTAVSALAPIVAESVGPANVRVIVARSPFSAAGARNNDQVIRYVLPPGVEAGDLFLTNIGGVGVEEVSFWDGTEWVAADTEPDAIPVPDDALRRGAVLVLTDVDMNQGPTGVPTLTDQPDAPGVVNPTDDDDDDDDDDDVGRPNAGGNVIISVEGDVPPLPAPPPPGQTGTVNVGSADSEAPATTTEGVG